MNSKDTLIKLIFPIAILLFSSLSYSQEAPNIKYLDIETIDKVLVDYDKDGDMDIIVAGVFVKKNQGRVYIIENIGLKYNKPEFIFSFPSIGLRQNLEILQDGHMTIITTIGTSPTGKQDRFTATLFKGEFEGLTIPPISTASLD